MADGHDQGGPEHVTARDANHGFSRLLARVEQGHRFVVTKNRLPVARLEPAGRDDPGAGARRRLAVERLTALMAGDRRSRDGWTFGGRRDALHGRSEDSDEDDDADGGGRAGA